MLPEEIKAFFTPEVLEDLLPPHRTDEFFEALYGDKDEGAYDISLAYKAFDSAQKLLSFEIQMKERPGKCLACNLTYGLPEVFSRHPIININGLVADINATLGDHLQTKGWSLKKTRTVRNNLHVIPLVISVE